MKPEQECDGPAGVVNVRPPAQTMARQAVPMFVGISGQTAGARGISMNRVVIPPGGAAEPHYHRDYETAIYVVQGRVETRYGPNLEHALVSEAGDFMFIPPGVPHQPRNLSDTETAIGIVARNDPDEQENVVRLDERGRPLG